MKSSPMNNSRIHICRTVSLALLCAASVTLNARADFSTSFETTSGSYTTGSTVIGVHDTGLTGTASWSALFGSTSAMVITDTAGMVKTGTQALQITDSTTSSAYGASYNLTGAVNYSNPFTLHFALNVASYGGTGNPVQFYLGDNSTSAGSKAYWTAGFLSSGFLYLYEASSVGGSSATAYNMGAYTTYSPLGNYVTFDITIDPTTHKYTGVTISGTTSGAVDKLSTLTSQPGAGEIPWLNGSGTNTAPLNYFVVAAGGAGTATFAIDDLSISNVPEPQSVTLLALAAGGMALACLRRRRACQQ